MDKDTSKVAEQTQSTETATTVVTESPVQPKRDSKKMLLMGAAIAAPILLVLGGLGVVAANRGKGNALSKIANYLPTEQIPLLKELGKSDAVTLRDAFSKELDLELTKKLGGREQRATVGFEAAGKDSSGGNVDVNLKVVADTATNKDADKAKFTMKVGGNVKSGIVNVDLGTEGIKADILMPNKNAIYMSMDLSKQVLDTFGPKIEQEMAGSGYTLKDILGKYAKLDVAQLTKDLEAMSGTSVPTSIDQAKLQKAGENLMNALSKDTRAVYEKSLGDFEKYTTLTNEGRKTINGQKAVVIKVTLKEDKVGDVVVDFTDGMITVLKNHKSDLEKFCVELDLEKSTGQKCSEMFTDEALKSFKLEENDKKQIREGIKMAFEYIKLEDLRFSVNVDDNTLVKSEFTIRATDKAVKEMSQSGNVISKFAMMFGTEELSRGKDVEITEPKEFTDLNKLIKENLNGKQNQLNNLKTRSMDLNTQDKMVVPTPTKTGVTSMGMACKVNATTTGTVDLLGQCISSKTAGSPCLAYADDATSVGTYQVTKELDFGICEEMGR
jgi:hypothetical protein